MSIRLFASLLLVALAVPQRSTAQERLILGWGEGRTDLHLTSAAQCSISFRAARGDRLPARWCVLWRGSQAAGLQIGRAEILDDVVTLKDVGLPGGPLHRLAQLRQGSSPDHHTFVIEANQSDYLSLVVVGIPDSAIDRDNYLVSNVIELNGGAPGSWPPTLFDAELDRDRGILTLRGWGLGECDRVDVIYDNRTSITARHVSRSARRIELEVPGNGSAVVRAYLHHPEHGWVDSMCVQSVGQRDQVSGEAKIIVWFMPGFVTGEWSSTPRVIDGVTINSPTLRSLLESSEVGGIRRLHRDALPARNPLGERTFPISMNDVYVVMVADTVAAMNLSSQLLEQGFAQTATVLDTRAAAQDPDDVYYFSEWHLHAITQAICGGWPQSLGCHLGLVGNYGLGPRLGPDIAILDTGAPDYHEDLTGGSPPGFPGSYFGIANFTNNTLLDINGHASAVAALAAAVTGNYYGMAAVAPGSRAWGFKVLGNTGFGEWDWVEDGLDYTRHVDKDIRIVNLSLGADAGPEQTLGATCRNARVAGQLLVASVGNRDTLKALLPARFDASVCAVGASWITGRRWTDEEVVGYPQDGGSSYSNHIDLVAPGGLAIRTVRLNSSPPYYDNINCPPTIPDLMGWGGGTSAAAAVATGAAALLLQQNQWLLGEDAQRILEIKAYDMGLVTGWDQEHGYGRVDPVAGMSLLGIGSHFVQDVIGGENGGLLGQDSSGVLETRTFLGVPGLTNGPRLCMKYKLSGVGTWNIGASTPPYAWTRASGTIGWRDSTVIDNYRDAPSATIVGGIATTHMVCNTYAYRIVGTGGEHLSWFPDEPTRCQIAFTVLGGPGTVSVVRNTALVEGPSLKVVRSVGRTIDLVVTMPNDGIALIELCDVAGRRITEVYRGNVQAGSMRLTWRGESNGAKVFPGMYFFRLRAGSQSSTARAVVLR